MRLGIATSFIIGGFLLVSILYLNNKVFQNSYEITVNSSDKTKFEAIRQIITQDFSRIGFGNASKINMFNPPHRINFSADVYGQGTSTVIWRFQENVQVHETSNPDDRVLKRNGPVDNTGGSKPTDFHVVDFELTGYSDVQGTNETTDKEEIRSLRIKIVTESPEPISTGSGDPYYSRTVWEKLIVPSNLQL